MLEKVARAICAADGFDWDAQADAMTSAAGSDNEQTGYLDRARAAIEAMQEPTHAMICAVLDSHDKAAGTTRVIDDWKVMISTALEGGK